MKANSDADAAEPEIEGEEEGASTDRLYLTMPSLAGLKQLLALWRAYVDERPSPPEATAWWKLFGYLSDVRVWSAKDRVDPSLAPYVTELLRRDPQRPVQLELDLWYRNSSESRESAFVALTELMEVVGGKILDSAIIEPIEYHAALVSVSASAAKELAELGGPIAAADMVMTARPQSLYRSVATDDPSDAAGDAEAFEPDGREPIAALLDGYPVQNHTLLRNRVDIDEVDVTAAQAPVIGRFHGTAMASLILHGDLTKKQRSLRRTLKIIPILATAQGAHEESTPLDKLPLALIYRAVVALKEGIVQADPLGPNIVLLNHSVCDVQAPFVRRPTAWAKLIDFLSYKYRVLFVVSAGNISQPMVVDAYPDRKSFVAADRVQRQVAVLRSVEAAKGTRGIFSPAEAVNALTVGAVHADGSGACPTAHINPYEDIGMTNLCSALGLGVNRGIKPDLIEDGGRQVAAASDGPSGVVIWGSEIGHIGQLAAAPDVFGGGNSFVRRSTGTSNAAALTTRSGILLADVIEAAVKADGQDWMTLPTRAVMLKTLMAHGCEWGDIGKLLDAAYPPEAKAQWSRRRETISRFLGFGKANLDRVSSGESHRVTLLGDDVIQSGALHEYRIPVPSAMLKNREIRRIIMTLSWCTPIRPTTVAYRGVALEIVDASGKRKFWKGVKPILQPHPDASRRGTLMHLVLEGKNATDFADTSGLFRGNSGAITPSGIQ